MVAADQAIARLNAASARAAKTSDSLSVFTQWLDAGEQGNVSACLGRRSADPAAPVGRVQLWMEMALWGQASAQRPQALQWPAKRGATP